MKRKRFTEEQIIGILRMHAAGTKPAELCRQHGISETTPYNWKARYGGMQISNATRLKSLEDEYRRLRRAINQRF
jgi:putative transposase